MAKLNVKNAAIVEQVTNTLAALSAKREAWEHGEFARANDTLYSLLADCLGTYSDNFLNASEAGKTEIREDIVKQLKAFGMRVQNNSQTITLFVKFVFGSDRKRASKYAYVLSVAVAEKQTQSTFSQWIKTAGGIEEVIRNTVLSEKTLQKRAAIADAVVNVQEKVRVAIISPLGTVSLSAKVNTGDRNLLITDKAPDGSLRVVGVLPNVSDSLLKRVQLEMGKLELQGDDQKKELGQSVTVTAPVNYVAKISPAGSYKMPPHIRSHIAKLNKKRAQANAKNHLRPNPDGLKT